MGDMRGERTKELLRETLRAILQAKPLEKVTVKEVLDGASVSKKAFYNHYADIYDLAVDAFLVPPERYQFTYKPFDEYHTMTEMAEAVLTSVARSAEFSRANPNLAKAISFNMGRSPYFDRAQMDGGITFLTEYAAHVAGNDGEGLITKDVCARYIFNGATGVVREWIRGGMEADPETLAKQCVAFTLQGASLMAGRGIDPEVLAFIEGWRFEVC